MKNGFSVPSCAITPSHSLNRPKNPGCEYTFKPQTSIAGSRVRSLTVGTSAVGPNDVATGWLGSKALMAVATSLTRV